MKTKYTIDITKIDDVNNVPAIGFPEVNRWQLFKAFLSGYLHLDAPHMKMDLNKLVEEIWKQQQHEKPKTK